MRGFLPCIIVISILLHSSCTSPNEISTNVAVSKSEVIKVRPDFKQYFDSCQVEGSIAIYDYKQQQWIVSDTVGIYKKTLPASSFKIINLLIALETKVIADENEVVQWPGGTDTVKYSYRPEIYHAMTVKEAFEVSAGWVFVELAKKIGKDSYKNYLALSHYGNGNLSQQDADFWNFGAFAISPMKQVLFLRNLYERKLPFSKRSIEIVKRVMLTEQKNGYSIYAKTGWTREGGINTGWWVGYLEKEGGTYFFATRLLQDRRFNSFSFGNCRKEITKTVLKDLDIIR